MPKQQHVQASEQWGKENAHAHESTCFYCGGAIDRHGDPIEIESSAASEILGRICRMMEADPLACYVFCMRTIHQDWTLDRIAKHLALFNPREVTRMAIYERIKKMIAAAQPSTASRTMLMPRKKRAIKVHTRLSTFELLRQKYTAITNTTKGEHES